MQLLMSFPKSTSVIAVHSRTPVSGIFLYPCETKPPLSALRQNTFAYFSLCTAHLNLFHLYNI